MNRSEMRFIGQFCINSLDIMIVHKIIKIEISHIL